jgi:hypothetical protein
MPANKFTRALYKTGTVASEKAAIANRDPARKAAAKEITAREGPTNAGGGRAVKMPAKPVAPKIQKVISMTTNMKSSPMTSKRK